MRTEPVRDTANLQVIAGSEQPKITCDVSLSSVSVMNKGVEE